MRTALGLLGRPVKPGDDNRAGCELTSPESIQPARVAGIDLRALRSRRGSAAAPGTGRRNPSADSRWRTGCGPSRSTPSPRIRWSGSSGSSIGWVETKKCSRMYSDGARFRCGTSSLRRFHSLSSRQPSAGSQAKPDSISTILSVGIALEHALHDEARHHAPAPRWRARSSPRCRTRASRCWSWPSRDSRTRGCRPAARARRPPRRSASSAAGRAPRRCG